MELKDKKIEELRTEIYRLGAINAKNQERLFEFKSECASVQHPSTYDSFSEWVDECYEGRVYLHPRAGRMIKESDYVNIDELCDAVNCLGDFYYYLHMNKRTRDDLRRSFRGFISKIFLLYLMDHLARMMNNTTLIIMVRRENWNVI